MATTLDKRQKKLISKAFAGGKKGGPKRPKKGGVFHDCMVEKINAGMTSVQASKACKSGKSSKPRRTVKAAVGGTKGYAK
jgi:DNA invertase Pin-like site-specific DNA recombinase